MNKLDNGTFEMLISINVGTHSLYKLDQIILPSATSY